MVLTKHCAAEILAPNMFLSYGKLCYTDRFLAERDRDLTHSTFDTPVSPCNKIRHVANEPNVHFVTQRWRIRVAERAPDGDSLILSYLVSGFAIAVPLQCTRIRRCLTDRCTMSSRNLTFKNPINRASIKISQDLS